MRSDDSIITSNAPLDLLAEEDREFAARVGAVAHGPDRPTDDPRELVSRFA